ncbi:hypothetical protein Pla110_21030 [Polystyrenella longa]|uniref:Uncharacterized protein n=1 Tax=Polystyrenella longa TaxID=2528007 RepID=A0A518CMG3_9PLAN|nr:hypothetical protein Pla110_21030 [Polystyrenella longa]
MNPRQHLLLLRFLRLLFFGLGVILLLPHISVQEDVVDFKTALRLLAGLALMFIPYVVVSRIIPARCPKCGKKAFVETKWHTPSPDESDYSNSRIKAFHWRCSSCGVVETIPSSVIDNLIPPFVQG